MLTDSQDRPLLARQSAVLIATALALAVLVLPPDRPARAGEADEAAAARFVAEELARQQSDDGLGGGTLADVVLALAAAGTEPAALDDAATALEETTTAYVGAEGSAGAGRLAKVLLAVKVLQADGSDFAGRDLEAELRATIGGDGRFGDAFPFTQALGVLALTRTTSGAPEATVQWLIDRQCPGGGFSFSDCTEDGNADVDSTAIIAQALLIAPFAEARDAAAAAIGYLLDVQRDDGAFEAFGEGNANSTGLAAQALRAAGETSAAEAAEAFVLTLQYQPDDPAVEKRGAIRYTADSDGFSLLFSTDGGILGLGAPSLAELAVAGPATVTGTACTGDEGVTVVVDASFFGAGITQGCAHGTPADGIAALRAAGFAVQDLSRYEPGTAVCRIDARPGEPVTDCTDFGPTAYWGYFHATGTAGWEFASTGPGGYVPPAGSYEGWRYGAAGLEPGLAPAPSVTATATPSSSASASPTATATPTSSPAATPSATPSTPALSTQRLAGAGRIETAIEVSKADFADGEAEAVVLARADLYADALAGTPLAVQEDAPLLLTPPDALAPAVAAELRRVLAPGGTVHLLGGTAALAPVVATDVEALGFTTERLAGANRNATAVEITSEGLDDVAALVLANGDGFPDALTGGVAAALLDGGVLLTGGDTVPPETQAYLESSGIDELLAVGGPAARAVPKAEPLSGATRFETALEVAQRVAPDAPVLGLATGFAFPDALAGGASVARRGGPLLLSDQAALTPSVAAYLRGRAGTVEELVLFGGEAALSQAVQEAAASALAGGQ